MKPHPKNTPLVVPVRIDRQRVASLLVGAFEGGSNYWIPRQPFEYVEPTEWRPVLDEGEEAEDQKKWGMYDYPLLEGGAVLFRAPTEAEYDAGLDVEKMTLHRLDLDTIARGLAVMVEKYPRHMSNFLARGDDASTSDVFLQCCLFGELVYG